MTDEAGEVVRQKADATRKVARAYRDVFDSETGQIVLKDMMRASLFFTDSGVMTDEELRQVEGARNLVRRTIRLCKLSDADLDRMMNEPVINN